MQEFPHPPTYRQEIVKPLFNHIRFADSCAVVGPGSMGKTRLLEFILRPDIQKHYLDKQTSDILILRTDRNRIGKVSEWGLYELMLTALVEGCDQNPKSQSMQTSFNELRQAVILKENDLLAQRQLELAVHYLVTELELSVCFLLDEFDMLYRDLPALAFAKLRSLRDANKNHLCYTLFLRQSLETLRDPAECEDFYELFSRHVLGLGPYNPNDTILIVNQIDQRHQNNMGAYEKGYIAQWSGGHPGLIKALYDLVLEKPQLVYDPAVLDILSAHTSISEECRKLWNSLPAEEQQGLVAVMQGTPNPADVERRLALKGLVCDGKVFSVLFERFVEAVE